MQEFFCKKCNKLSPQQTCQFCGYKKTRPPKSDDAVFLATKRFVFAGMLEQLLTQNDIPYIKQAKLGEAMNIRGLRHLEIYTFLVSYQDYAAAKAILDEYFAVPEK